MYSVQHRYFCALALAASTFFLPSLHAQQTALPDGATNAEQPAQDPLTRPLSDKEKFKQQKELKQELKGPYKKWLDEDVRWIITDQEMKAFKSLSNDEEREAFIENFWLRRNPNPDSPENEFKEEHYRRIAYANEHFPAGKPGWKTDRGHIYIAYGKPTSIPTPPAVPMSVPWTRAVARHPPSPSRPGTTGISKASATTSISSSWTPASAATTT